jgi:hypothetical protein
MENRNNNDIPEFPEGELPPEQVQKMIWQLEDVAEQKYDGLLVDVGERKLLMSDEEVAELDKQIHFGTETHFFYLSELLEIGHEQAIIDCMAAYSIRLSQKMDQDIREIQAFLEQVKLRELISQQTIEEGMRIYVLEINPLDDPDRPEAEQDGRISSVQARQSTEFLRQDPVKTVFDNVDRKLRDMFTEFRSKKKN